MECDDGIEAAGEGNEHAARGRQKRAVEYVLAEAALQGVRHV